MPKENYEDAILQELESKRWEILGKAIFTHGEITEIENAIRIRKEEILNPSQGGE